jgi:hypothetical protein
MSGNCLFCGELGDVPAAPFGRVVGWLCQGCAVDPAVRFLTRRVEGEPGSLAEGLAALHAEESPTEDT